MNPETLVEPDLEVARRRRAEDRERRRREHMEQQQQQEDAAALLEETRKDKALIATWQRRASHVADMLAQAQRAIAATDD